VPDRNDGDLSREVFIQYGRATHAAAEMERCLVNLAQLLEPEARDNEFSGFFRAPDGQPAPSIERLAARLSWDPKPLRRAVELRTYLRDRFWQEKSDSMHYFDGRRRLVDELTGIADELIRINDRMASEASRLFIRYGLSEKIIADAVDKIVGSGKKPAPKEPERDLTACVAYRREPGERGYIPALQCSDGSLLLITREGLTSGPESPSRAQCVEFLHLSRYFPTRLCGPVESLGPWSWRVALKDQLELYVEPGKDEKVKSVQWGIRKRQMLEETRTESNQ